MICNVLFRLWIQVPVFWSGKDFSFCIWNTKFQDNNKIGNLFYGEATLLHIYRLSLHLEFCFDETVVFIIMISSYTIVAYF